MARMDDILRRTTKQFLRPKASGSLPAFADTASFTYAFDTIPNYVRLGLSNLKLAKMGGMWTDTTTWSGGVVPTSGNYVGVPPGVTVCYDVLSGQQVPIPYMTVFGGLEMRADLDTKLDVGTLICTSGSVFRATPQAGKRSVVMVLNQALPTSGDGTQFSTGLIFLGRVDVAGRETTPYVRLNSEPTSGATALTLEAAPVNWLSGYYVYLPPTYSGMSYNNMGNMDVAQILGLTGTTLTLNAACQTYHTAAYDNSGVKRMKPLAFTVNRDVEFYSEAISGTRGHVFFGYGCRPDVRYARFYGLGRTTFDTTASGTNQVGRYAVHCHHLDWGPELEGHSGYCGRFVGNYVEDAMKWGYAVHDSHFLLFSGNVAFNVEQWGFTTEEGGESYNIFDSNLSCRTRRFGAPNDGVGFWVEGSRNTWRNNISTNARTGFWVVGLSFGAEKTFTVPRFPGDTVGETFSYVGVGLGVSGFPFIGNEAFGGGVGWWLDHKRGVNRIQNFKAWSLWESQTFGWEGGIYDNGNLPNYTIDENPLAIGAVLDVNGVSLAILMSGEYHGSVAGNGTGMMALRLNNMQNGTVFAEHCLFLTPRGVHMALSPSAGATGYPVGPVPDPLRRTELRDCLFQSGLTTPFYMDYSVLGDDGGRTPCAGNYVYSYNHDRLSGYHVQGFWAEQRSGYLTKASGQIPTDATFTAFGAYTSGGTNYANYVFSGGRATAGQVMPAWGSLHSGFQSGYATVLSPREDTFNRADALSLGSPSDGGTVWQVTSGTWGITDNTAFLASGSAEAACYLEASGMVNGQSRVTIVGPGDECGLCARVEGDSYIIARWARVVGNSGSIGLYAYSGGIYFNMTSDNSEYATHLNSGDVLGFRWEGAGAVALLNGTVVLSGRSTLNPFSCKHGLRNNASRTTRYDNFKITLPYYSGTGT